MKIDGKKIVINYKPTDYFDSSIGRLAIFSISYKHMRELTESLGNKVDSCEPVEFLKRLLLYICYPEKELGEDKNKPDEAILSNDEINKLSEDELEKIAKLHLEHESYLYKDQVRKTKTIENGKKATYFEDGEIIHPKEGGEDDIQYLHRLYKIKEKEDNEEMKRMRERLLGSAHFSDSVSKSIEDTFAMGNSLSKMVQGIKYPNISESLAQSMKGFKASDIVANQFKNIASDIVDDQFKNIARPKIMPQKFEMLQIDHEAIEKNRRAPFEDLGKRLNQLVELTGEAIEFATESNNTQLTIASGIKSSSESAAKLSICGIILTIIVIALTGFTMWLSYSQSKETSIAAERYTEQVVQGLGDINQSVVGNNRSVEPDLLKDILSEIKTNNKNQITTIDNFFAEQADIIKQINQQRDIDRQAIEDLKQIISDLENQLENIKTENNPVTGDK